ncbi:glycosyltransferase family 4 protein [Acidobacteria bacterium AB60]|nr:glycosyltransferase family 4 protein [Acidobacteria bacterium AB60]
MRVLMTTDTLGGVWTFSLEMAAGLLERGDTVLLISFGRPPSAAQREQWEQLELRYSGRFESLVTEIPVEWAESEGPVYERGAALLEQEAMRFAPDLIHTNQFCYGAIDVPIPRVITAHQDVFGRNRSCDERRVLRSPFLTRYKALAQQGLNSADAVVAPTRWMLDDLARSFTLSRNTAIVAHGRQLQARFQNFRELRAITAGRVTDAAKGLDTLAHVTAEMPIVVAGETRPGEEGKVPGFGTARLIGQLAEAEMVDLLQHSSVYLCLSRYEPFGMTALEAGLCGCAVVARNIPSLLEVWGSAAMYFDDADALSTILARLHSNATVLHDARESAYRRAQRFTRARMVEQYLSLYRRLVTPAERTQYAA